MSAGVLLPPDVNRVLFVSGFPSSITGDDLYKIFGEFGPLRQVRIGDTNDTKGTAFVVFEDIYDAKTAVDQLTGFRLSKSKYLQIHYFHDEAHKKRLDKKRRRKEQLSEFMEKTAAEAERASAAMPAPAEV